MKKKVLMLLTVLMLVLDVVAVAAYWRNYNYLWTQNDTKIVAIIAAVCIIVCVIVGILSVMKARGNTITNIVIAASIVFVIGTLSCYIYNENARVEISADNVEKVIADTEYDEKQIAKFVEDINDGKYLKRNSDEEGITPDKMITIVMKDKKEMKLSYYGDNVIEVSYKDSGASDSYFMYSKNVAAAFEK